MEKHDTSKKEPFPKRRHLLPRKVETDVFQVEKGDGCDLVAQLACVKLKDMLKMGFTDCREFGLADKKTLTLYQQSGLMDLTFPFLQLLSLSRSSPKNLNM